MNPEDQLAQDLRAVDPWYWAYHNKIMLKGTPFELDGHEFQVDMLQSDARRQCGKKGSQMTFTESEVLKTLHGMIHGRYPQGVLYLFPTRDDVTDFAKGRFNPLITDNPIIGQYVQNTDAANIKRIGNAMLYLRGARVSHKIEGIKKSASQLKSVPVDKVVFDEIDEMDMDMVDLALKRMGHSEIREESYLSTPSVPDFGIDKLYNESDQRIWMIVCDHCNKETCLELEFPNCLEVRSDDSVYRACKHCKKKIYPHNGHWVARYPDRDFVGRWISRLNSKYAEPKEILDAFNNPPHGNLAEVYNSDLGMAYVAAENKLTTNDLYNICGQDAMLTKHPGPTCMGVDVGRLLYVVIGHHPDEYSIKADKFARVSSFDDVHDLAKRFNVSCGVIDREPETRKAREFQEKEDYEIFLCDYQEHQRKAPAFDSKTGMVIMNRTELCDASHDLVKVPGRYVIPRRNEEVEQYALEMSNIAKVLEEDKETGSRSYRYRKVGENDHYRHATNYMMLAAMHTGVYEPEFDKNQPKDKWTAGFEDKEGGSWMGS